MVSKNLGKINKLISYLLSSVSIIEANEQQNEALINIKIPNEGLK